MYTLTPLNYKTCHLRFGKIYKIRNSININQIVYIMYNAVTLRGSAWLSTTNTHTSLLTQQNIRNDSTIKVYYNEDVENSRTCDFIKVSLN